MGMAYARFEYRNSICEGLVKGDEVVVLEGSFLGEHRETQIRHRLSEVRMLPPVTPTKVVCIARNYRGLINQINAEIPEKPIFFLKPPSCLIGNHQAIRYPREAERVIFEGELALVVKDTMSNVPEKEALQHVLGYCCFNDVTELSMVEKNLADLSLAKGFDTFGPVGPYVVTDVDPGNLEISTWLNGALLQSDNTRNCLFGVEYILHYLSQAMTLYPGDIVSTGTPEGIAAMKPGDIVEVEISGLGRLTNSITTW